MPRNDRDIFLKQLSHLSLSQPNGIIFQPDIDGSLAVVGLVYDDLVFHGLVLCGKDNKKIVPNYCTGKTFVNQILL